MARVIVSPEAMIQSQAVDEWWRAHRESSPDLFVQELAAAFANLARAPLMGRLVVPSTVPGVRRVILRATRYHVYYAVGEDALHVLAVWSSVRGRGPDLSQTP